MPQETLKNLALILLKCTSANQTDEGVTVTAILEIV